ncbi:tetratricopeptide repeat protein, partial [Turicibacter sanguinis]|nr:tetratricopeptide repeat protein [Turicibacter sanguinis]
MDYIKKKLGFLLLAISIGIITLFIIGREKTNYHLEIIKRAIKENVVLDVEQLRQYSEKIEVKLSKDEMDYFTLGYMNEVEGNEESAIANYHQVTELISEKTDPFVILYTTTYLAKQMMDTKRYQQALDYVMIGVNNIEIEDYNDHAKSVWELLLITINNDRGEHFTTQTLEEVLKYEKKLNEETLLYLISKQTPLYCLRHQYADAINAALKGIKLAEQQHDQATKMKILIELGNVFKILENYDAAKQVIQEALKMVVKDTDLSDNLKLYAYKNLAQISLMQEDYEQVIAYTGLMKEYESKVKSEIAIEYEILRYLIYAQVDIYYGHIDYAYQSLLKATELFKQDENYTVFEKDLYYLNTLGQLYYHQENYDEAIKTYHELLELSEKRESLGFQKESIAKLLAIYQELGRIDEYQLLTDKLIAFSDVQQNRIGNEYIFYAIQSHQNDLILQRTIQYRIINMSIFMVLGSIIIYGILKFVRLVSQNRKDHLTNL